MKYICGNTRRHGPPKRYVFGLAVLLALLLPVCVLAQLNPYEGMTFSPAQPGDGSTLSGRIARGDFICLPYSGDTCGSGPWTSLTDYIRENLKLVYYIGDEEITVSKEKLSADNFTDHIIGVPVQ